MGFPALLRSNFGLRLRLLGGGPNSLLPCLVLGWLAASAQAAELKPDTAAAFDRYIRATEAQHTADFGRGYFLVLDSLPDPARKQAYARLREGQNYIEPLHTKENGRIIPISGGLLHHWVGVTFIPGASLSEVLAVLQNYDNQKNIYRPYVRRSELLEHKGNEYRIYLQFYHKSIATVVINANFAVRYAMPGPTQALSQSYSTRIAEVENPDKPNEHELPVGNDHGYLWRLDTYWRVEEQDGGAYVQVESIALSRSIPALAAWLINPLVRSIPRSVLSSLLTATRKAVLNGTHQPPNQSLPAPPRNLPQGQRPSQSSQETRGRRPPRGRSNRINAVSTSSRRIPHRNANPGKRDRPRWSNASPIARLRPRRSPKRSYRAAA